MILRTAGSEVPSGQQVGNPVPPIVNEHCLLSWLGQEELEGQTGALLVGEGLDIGFLSSLTCFTKLGHFLPESWAFLCSDKETEAQRKEGISLAHTMGSEPILASGLQVPNTRLFTSVQR